MAEAVAGLAATITEIINISKIPAGPLRKICQTHQIDKNRSLLIEISKLKTEEEMRKLIENIGERQLKREDTRDLSKLLKGKEPDTRKSKHYIFNYSPKEDRTFSVKIEFKKETVSRSEVIRVLEELLAKLKHLS